MLLDTIIIGGGAAVIVVGLIALVIIKRRERFEQLAPATNGEPGETAHDGY